MVRIPANFFRAEIKWTFDGLAVYARIMEDQIERLSNADRLRLKRTSFQDTAEEQLEWDKHRWKFEQVLPRALRYSCVVSLMTAVEGSLMDICEKIHDSKKLSVTPRRYERRKKKERKNLSFLDIRLSYLKEIAKIRIGRHLFKISLDDLKRMRDHIVHSEGRVTGERDREKLSRIVNSLEGFTVGHGYVEIKKGACEVISRHAAEWIDDLMDACGPPYENSLATGHR